MAKALVTGGTRGIGAGIVAALLARGFEVTATGLGADEVASIEAKPGLSAIQLDVTDDRSVSDCIGAFETLDVLVNCAGTIARGGAEYDLETFRHVIEVNLTGTMRMCLAAKPLLERSRGAIVNTASMLSFFGGPAVPAYTASKGGIAQLTKALAASWAADGIRVNAIAPGWIETELTRALVSDDARSSAIIGRTPMQRWGRPDDIGGAAAFLVSPDAAFMTGVILPVDGGYLAV